MMRKITQLSFIAITFLFVNGLKAQITVTNSTYPIAGEVAYYSAALSPTIDLGTASETTQTWDFSDLEESFPFTITFDDAEDGDNVDAFPDADLFYQDETGEVYTKINTGDIEILGYSGNDPIGILGDQLTINFNPTAKTYFTPATYGNSFVHESAFALSIDGELVSIESLPIEPDSFRVRFTSDITYNVDAFGSMTTPAGTFDVIRIHQKDIRDTRIDAYMGSFLGWTDVTDLVTPFFPDVSLGLDTLNEYVFLNDLVKEPIARVRMTDGYVTRVDYKAAESTDINDVAVNTSGIFAYPNPATDVVNFKINAPKGNYTLKLFNIVGKEVMQKQVKVNGTTYIDLSVLRFKQGTYLYALLDSRNNVVATKRLVVLKP